MRPTLTFLGTGTSTGVPQLNCKCRVCLSADPRDKRTRTSAVLETDGGNILIDCGPDFVQQILRNFNFKPIDAVLLTHSHYDHVGGIDDLRPYTKTEGLPIYCRKDVETDIRTRIPYCFRENPYPGVPHFVFREIKPGLPFECCGMEVMPLDIIHSPLINNIVGYRFGDMLAYITDAKVISEETMQEITGVKTLVINALRIKPHASHQNLAQALAVIERVKPEQAFLVHLSHDMGLHADVSATLPTNVRIAVDGEKIEL